jgi:hypothetical protein
MAISTDRGIGSWQREGFEHYVIKEVRDMLDSQRREYRQDMESVGSRMGQVHKEMAALHRKVDAVNGFYTWLIEVYPETVAQYKALMDLQKLGEKDE